MTQRFTRIRRAVLGIAASGAMLFGFVSTASAHPCDQDEGVMMGPGPIMQQAPVYQPYYPPEYLPPVVYREPPYRPPVVVYRQPPLVVEPAWRVDYSRGWGYRGHGGYRVQLPARGSGRVRFTFGF